MKIKILLVLVLLSQFLPETNIVNLMYSKEEITKYNQFITWKDKNKEEYKKILENKSAEVKKEKEKDKSNPNFLANSLEDNSQEKTKDKQFLYEEIRSFDNEIVTYNKMNKYRNAVAYLGIFLFIFFVYKVSRKV